METQFNHKLYHIMLYVKSLHTHTHTHTHTTHTHTPCIPRGVLLELSVLVYELVPQLPWHGLEEGMEGEKGKGRVEESED